MSLLSQMFAPGTRMPRWFSALLLLGAILLGWWYWTAAVAHGDRQNLDPFANDQKVYMNGAATMVGSNYTYSVPRMRMPGYMVLLSVVADPQVDHFGFFSTARRFNVALSLVCLVTLFFCLRPWLGTGLTTCLVLIASMQVFILRAAYVQPELFLTTLITLSIALLVEVLRRPTWWKALLAGLICCLWYLTKASALVAVASFIAAMAVKALLSYKGNWRGCLLAMALVAIGFTVPMSPYLLKSYRTFGSPFYNAQSKYYMWSEGVRDKILLQQSGIDESLTNINLGDMKHLPGPLHYWREHSWEGIIHRLRDGSVDMLRVMSDEYTFHAYLIIVWFCIMLWAISRNFAAAISGIKAHWVELLYVGGLIAIFIFLFGWFTPLKVGPRLIISVSLVPIFFSMAVIHHFLKDQTETLFGTRVSVEKLLIALFLIPWLIATCIHLPSDLATGYFGG